MNILLLEDETYMVEHIKGSLAALDPQIAITHVSTCQAAIASALETPFDCMVLDRKVPDGDGLDALSQLRAAGIRIPAVMLTSSNAVEQRVEGIDAGADDYLGKDFEPIELLARIRAAARRAGQEGHPMILKRGSLELHRTARKAAWNRQPLKLEPRQFEVLLCIAEAYPDGVSNAQIWKHAWPEWTNLEPQKAPIQTNISRLRKQLVEQKTAAEISFNEGLYFYSDPNLAGSASSG